MKTTVNRYDFVRAFETCGRKDQFTTSALLALFEYLEEYENSCAVELELDPIGICCEWAEYETATEAAKTYGYNWENAIWTEEVMDREQASLEWLRNQTQVVEFDGGIVIQLF
jgi:hypothetical protein